MESPCVGLGERKEGEEKRKKRKGKGRGWEKREEGKGERERGERKRGNGGEGKGERERERERGRGKGEYRRWNREIRTSGKMVLHGSLILLLSSTCCACCVFTSPGGVLPSGESSTYSAAHVTTSASDRASPTKNWGQLVRWLSSRPKHTSNSCERELDVMVDFTAPWRNEKSQV